MKRPNLSQETTDHLLALLGVRPSECRVARRWTKDGDEILVIVYPGCPLKETNVPPEFKGYPVKFERRPFPQLIQDTAQEAK